MKEIVEEGRTIKDFKKDYPDEIELIEETSLNYMGDNHLELLKTEFPVKKWKYLFRKLEYPYEIFNSLDVFQKHMDNLKKEDFFSKLKNKCPDDEEIEQTK